MNIQSGKRVRHKTGGPDMTVQETMRSGKVRCQWFVDNDLRSGYFRPEELDLLD